MATDVADELPYPSAMAPTDVRGTLEAERARLIAGSQGEIEALIAPGAVAIEDQAPLLHDQFVAPRQRQSYRRKLRLIEAALARLERGEFGICEDCEEPIPAGRLRVVPWAALCVSCQQRSDATGVAA